MQIATMSRLGVALKPLLLIVAAFQLIQVSESRQLVGKSQQQQQIIQKSQQQHSNLQIASDPIVFDVNSLYTPPTSFHESAFTSKRRKRSTGATATTTQQLKSVDACQSKMEVITPYYATNSKGKLRTIVNSELMQQAIQVETCVRSPQASGRCNAQSDCGCEQKFKWHRLLVLEPQSKGGQSTSSTTNKGLFMDWFLFPSNCVCRCKPMARSAQFLKAIGGAVRPQTN